MRKQSVSVVTLLFGLALWFAVPASAMKMYSFTLGHSGSINGTQLEAGTYKLELTDSGEAIVYQRGERIISTPVEVEPLLKSFARNSILIIDGAIKEIRLKKQVVVFGSRRVPPNK